MHPVAVVPIFMSAGAAVLPTVIAAVTSVAAIVFKPRELVRQFRLRPALMSGILAGLFLAVGLAAWWIATPAKAQARSLAHTEKTDWSQVARNLLAQEKLHNASSAAATAIADSADGNRLTDDFSRTMFKGTIAPMHLTQAWKYEPEKAMFLAHPAISADGKRIYVAGCISVGNIGLLACLDADSGKPLWEQVEAEGTTMKPFFSSPALTADGKFLIIGQGLHQDRDCSLMCFDTANGELKWAVKTPLHIESSPALFGDMAVVGAGAIEGSNGMAQGDPGFVFAVRISDGKKLWQQAVNDPESSPAIGADGTVFIGSGFNGTAVYALRSESDEALKAKGVNRVLWKTAVEFPVTGPLTLIGDKVIAGGGNSDTVHSAHDAKGQVMALDVKTGSVIWKVAVEDSVLGSMAARAEIGAGGIVICPCRTGELLALSLKDGAILWRSRMDGRVPLVAGVAFGAGKSYGVSTDGNMGIVDAATGKVLEKIYVDEPGLNASGLSMAAPQVTNGKVIVGSETGGVRMYVGE